MKLKFLDEVNLSCINVHFNFGNCISGMLQMVQL